MKFILGEKKLMTQFFDREGNAHPATRIFVGKVMVLQVKTKDSDGYSAVKIAYGTKNPRRITKSARGQFKDLGDFRYTKEFRIKESEIGTYSVGQVIDLASFHEGDVVQASGISKGKGFQGGVKRHGFHGGRRTHGQKHSEREPGAIGGGGRAGGRVAKGIRMAGRMGGDRITVKNLQVLAVDSGTGEIVIHGAVPGRRGSFIELMSEIA